MSMQIYTGTNEHDGVKVHDSEEPVARGMYWKELEIPASVGFCKSCFRLRRNGSAYCGECQNEAPRMKVYEDKVFMFPLLRAVQEKFKFDDNQLYRIIYTYGDTIYNMNNLSPDLIAHELTHVFQQKRLGKENWWKVYLADDMFRVKQEVEAYHNQYQFFIRRNDDNAEMRLDQMAKDLSGPIYGKVISFEAAKQLIKNYVKTSN